MDYRKNLVTRPVRREGGSVRGRQAPVPYMSNDLVPGCNKYIELSWIYEIPRPNPHLAEHAHDYNEIVLFIGTDTDNPEVLGAEIEYYLGGQPLTFDSTAAIYIPRGVKHGPVIWKKVDRPHLEMSLIIDRGRPGGDWPGSGAGKSSIALPQKKDNINYEPYLVRRPIYVGGTRVVSAFKHRARIYMTNELIPDCNIYLAYGWTRAVPEPNPPILEHCHDYEEIVLEIGCDPAEPEALGAEIEFCEGGQPLKFDTTAAIYVPGGVKHGPLTWKRVDRPHIQMPIVIGAGTRAQAQPAGDRT